MLLFGLFTFTPGESYVRVLGCGWTQYATRWSSKADSRIGTVAHLQTLLEEIIVEERSRARFTAGTDRGLPTEAAPPQHEARNLGQLGTADADAVEISKRALFSAEELEAKAQAAMKRREESGVADRVERLQQEEAPAFDQALVGKRIEVLWKYFDKDTNKPHMIWSTGTVKRIADGLTDKRSPRARSILPGGTLLCGRGMRIPTLTSRRVSSGSFCCPGSGIQRPTHRSTAGASTRASLEPRRGPHQTA